MHVTVHVLCACGSTCRLPTFLLGVPQALWKALHGHVQPGTQLATELHHLLEKTGGGGGGGGRGGGGGGGRKGGS